MPKASAICLWVIPLDLRNSFTLSLKVATKTPPKNKNKKDKTNLKKVLTRQMLSCIIRTWNTTDVIVTNIITKDVYMITQTTKKIKEETKMMKSKVCTLANTLVKKGYTKSEAFTKAWALVKAEAISQTMHIMSVSSDRFNTAQKSTVNSMSIEYSQLMNRANSIQTAAEKAEAAAKAQKAMTDWNRREDIKFELSCMVRKGQMNSDRYIALRAELNTIAA